MIQIGDIVSDGGANARAYVVWSIIRDARTASLMPLVLMNKRHPSLPRYHVALPGGDWPGSELPDYVREVDTEARAHRALDDLVVLGRIADSCLAEINRQVALQRREAKSPVVGHVRSPLAVEVLNEFRAARALDVRGCV
jgi:hypothetical protein